jgi:hypothetical protein
LTHNRHESVLDGSRAALYRNSIGMAPPVPVAVHPDNPLLPIDHGSIRIGRRHRTFAAGLESGLQWTALLLTSGYMNWHERLVF